MEDIDYEIGHFQVIIISHKLNITETENNSRNLNKLTRKISPPDIVLECHNNLD